MDFINFLIENLAIITAMLSGGMVINKTQTMARLCY
jgi:hypothetical protein